MSIPLPPDFDTTDPEQLKKLGDKMKRLNNMSLKQNILKLLEGYTIVDGDAEISDGNILPSQGSDTDSVSVVENGERKIDRIISLIEQEVRKCVDAPYGTTDMGTPEYEKGFADGLRTAREVIKTDLDKLFNE